MKKLNKILSVGLSLALCAGMVLPALAVEYDISKGNVIIDSTGSSGVVMGQEESSRNEFTEDDRSVTIRQSEEGPTGHTITVGENVTDTTITLSGVNIDASGSGEAAMSVGANSDVTVELDGENTLKSGANHAGLELNGGGSVTIQDETTEDDGAALTAQGGERGAGIGSGVYGKAGSITINGGDVTAQGGKQSAGIGSGYWAEAGDITITGGKVTAQGTHHAAGIGTGEGGRAGSITITGGDVTAGAGTGGAAIGGSNGGNVSSIIIVGTVTDKQGVAGVPTISTDAKNPLGGLTGAFGGSLLADATKATVQILDSKGKVIASAEMDQESLAQGLILRAPAGKYYVYVTTDANPEGAFVTGADGENFTFEIGNTVVEQEKPFDIRTPECRVNCQFVSGTPDMDLPEMPEFPGDDDIVRNITSTLEASCDKEYDDIVVPGGVWSFAGWSSAPIFNEDGALAADVTLVGTWTFTAKPGEPSVPSQPSMPDVVIDDPDVPLAGPVSLQELLEELHRRAGASGEVLAWAVDNGLTAADADGTELVTVGALRAILSRYAEVFATNVVEVPDLTTLTGEDGDLVLNCGEVLVEFLGEE